MKIRQPTRGGFGNGFVTSSVGDGSQSVLFFRIGATYPLIAGGGSDFLISLEAKPTADDFFSERLATIGHWIFISDSVGAPLFSESQITS